MITSDRSTAQISFLNQLDLAIEFQQITQETAHEHCLPGWQGLKSLVCLDDQGKSYQVDIRHAWSENIFKQHLFDFNWTEIELLCKKIEPEATGTKIIIYLCEESTTLQGDKITQVPSHYLVGRNYLEVIHVYLSLPRSHPFELPKISHNSSDSDYATTRWFSHDDFPTLSKEEHSLDPKSSEKVLCGGLRTQGLIKQGTKKQPLISIITVVYNGAKYLEQTIQSVINQTNSQIEYIIVDGGSNDGTLDIIRKYEAQIDYWVSEPDKGIYDAMNKGTKLANGTHTLHINADDLLWRSDALDLELTKQNLVAGVYVFQPEENFVKKRPPKKLSGNKQVDIIRCPVYHPGFIGLNNQNSIFDDSYRIIADNIVIANKLAQEPHTYLPATIAIHRGGGVSAENALVGDREIARAVFAQPNIAALWCLAQKVVYSLARDFAKKLGIVSLRRKYF